MLPRRDSALGGGEFPRDSGLRLPAEDKRNILVMVMKRYFRDVEQIQREENDDGAKNMDGIEVERLCLQLNEVVSPEWTRRLYHLEKIKVCFIYFMLHVSLCSASTMLRSQYNLLWPRMWMIDVGPPGRIHYYSSRRRSD